MSADARYVAAPHVDAKPNWTTGAPLARATVFLMAACCATSVANVYYAQPLLDAVGAEFDISEAALGGVISATQLGCALALMLVVPLGDLLNRKVLLSVELALLAAVLIVVSASPGPILLLFGMVGLGLFGTAVTQGMIAYAATLSPPAERGGVIGMVQSGVLVGVLGARSLAGFAADLAGWRTVFVVSALLAAVMLLVCLRVLPRLTLPSAKIRYSQLLLTMLKLLAGERVLQVRGTLGLLVFAAFGAFWSALVLPLRAEPYQLPHTVVGAFGLVGMAGALAAARAGRLADRGQGELTTCVALLCMIVSWAPMALLQYSLLALVLGIVLLDMGGQAVHVTNQSMIFKSRPELHSRLVGCYMLFYAVGLGSGAAAATYAYWQAGWPGVCWLGLGISIVAFGFWSLTRHIASAASRG
jgi:predicted MFS family arabinose efflux permease